MKNRIIITAAILMISAVICIYFLINNTTDNFDLPSDGEDTTMTDINKDDADDHDVTENTEEDKADKNETTEQTSAQEQNRISIPYVIPGTNLVLSRIDSYDGIFLEDGSDKEVTDLTAIVIENRGKTGVEYADITIEQRERQLKFIATVIPAGKTIVVQEQNGQTFEDDKLTSCYAEIAELSHQEMSDTLVKVTELEDGSLEVKNLTDQTLPMVRIFYKFALEKNEIYVGGITYTAKVTELEAGGVQTISPAHYAPGASEIMMIRVYETLE